MKHISLVLQLGWGQSARTRDVVKGGFLEEVFEHRDDWQYKIHKESRYFTVVVVEMI